MDTSKPPGNPRRLPDWATPGWLLGAFSLLFLLALALTHALTAERIAVQEKLKLARQLQALLPPGGYDNAPGEDAITRAGRVVYRARLNGRPAAALIKTTAPDGYSGAIELLVGIAPGGELLGVRVLQHRETPGLGDAIELRRSDWLLGFNGKSLGNPAAPGWAVKKDGGAFDAFTGATITPRAVVGEVKSTLEFFRDNRHNVFR